MIKMLKEVFGVEKPIIGVVHLLPTPGSPRYRGDGIEHILCRAVGDARALGGGGIDGIIVENYGDAPFEPTRVEPQTIAAIALAVKEVADAVELPIGVNVLRNDALGAMAIANVTGARFVRINVYIETMVTDQGIIDAPAHEVLRYKKAQDADIKIFADVHVKHAVPLVPRAIDEVALDATERGMADALIITGPRTGAGVNLEDLVKVKGAVPDAPVLAGSGVNATNVLEVLKRCDGAIVGTDLKVKGVTENPVDQRRVMGLMEAVRGVR